MKKLITICLLALGFFSASQTAKGATYTVGAGGNYTSLYAAFDDINNGNITGNIILQITSNLVETNTCQLDFSGFGGSYSSVKIYPTAPNLSITGYFWPGHLIHFNGADNVTIDGRVNATGTTPSLKIAYTGSSSAGNSVIYLGNNAQYNTIQYCDITTNAYDIDLIHFESAQDNIGNSHNVIAHNNIYGMIGTYSLTSTGIMSGTANNASSNNHSDSIINNNIYNLREYAIRLNTGTSGWYIANNSIYDTYGDNSSTARTFYGILVEGNNSSATASVEVKNNYVGGTAPLCSGNALSFENNNKTFVAIRVVSNFLKRAYIENNSIKSIKVLNTTSSGPFNGISASGRLTIHNNNIGNMSDTASIEINTLAFSNIKAINIGVGDSMSIKYNQIGAIRFTSSAQPEFQGIYCNPNYTNGNFVEIVKNKIGSPSVANSIFCGNSVGNFSGLYGIQTYLPRIVNIDSNEICNMSTESEFVNSTISGIYMNEVTFASTINTNKVHHLKGAAKTYGINILNIGAVPSISNNTVNNLWVDITGTTVTSAIGIYSYVSNITSVLLSKNFVHSLEVSNSNSTVIGIHGENFNTGSEVVNNVVALTSSNGGMVGLKMPNDVNTKLIHNTVYVSSTTNRNSLTTCLDLNDNIPNIISNNIFFNGMANASGVTKYHSCIYNRSNSNIANANYNVYRVPNTSAGGAVAYWNNTASTYNNLNQWKFITNQDTNSVNIDPLFVNPGGSQAADYYPTASVIGANYLGITNDYYNNNRGSIFWMGALQSQAPLPLKWEYFHATDYKNSVELVWATTYEENVSHFELEYSTNSTEWKSLAKVMANNESSNQYSYSDRIPFSGNRYYRIKQVDADNKFSYSKVEKVTRASNSEVTFYPNPCTMNLNIISSDDASYEVEVYSLDGKVVLNSSINSGSEKLDVSNLKSGIYFIKLFNKDRTITSKFTKQ